jgi:hypothetical protein
MVANDQMGSALFCPGLNLFSIKLFSVITAGLIEFDMKLAINMVNAFRLNPRRLIFNTLLRMKAVNSWVINIKDGLL